MKLNLLSRILTLIILIQLQACYGQVNTSPDDPYQSSHPEEFSAYWFSGNAEINCYELVQSRYGEQHKGDVILIFVTEDFLIDEQVKKEYGSEESLKVLKSNLMKKFPTGIYDYSVMTSTFTPTEFRKNPATLKVSTSVQDWCGHTYSQINSKDRMIFFELRSYFQNEGDKKESIAATYLEDDIWNRMRLEPQTLPLGKIQMIPSLEFLRLRHKKFKAYTCEANLYLQVNDTKSGEEFYLYELNYPEIDRKLKVKCEARFPFKILGWEETTNAGSSNPQVSSAELKKVEKMAYWRLNSNKEEALRDSLGLRNKFE